MLNVVSTCSPYLLKLHSGFFTLTPPPLSEIQSILNIHDNQPTCNIWKSSLHTSFLKTLNCPCFPISLAAPSLVCSADFSSTWCLNLGVPQALSSDYFSISHFFTDLILIHGPPIHYDTLIIFADQTSPLNSSFYSQLPTQHLIYIFMCILPVFLTPPGQTFLSFLFIDIYHAPNNT